MRTKNSLKNIISVTFFNLLIGILGFIKVRVFVNGLSNDIYSLNQLFYQIFSYITIADIGFGLIQTAVFVISSTILIFVTKPFVKKFATNKNPIKTNVYSIIGKNGIVTQDINPIEAVGQIKISGEVWSAISQDNQIIPKDTKIRVLEIKGVKAIVEPVLNDQ